MGATLTRELVAAEVKHRQFNAFPKYIWDWTCQKKGLSKIEAKIYTGATGGSVRVLAIERTGQRPIPSAGACSLKIKASVFVSLL